MRSTIRLTAGALGGALDRARGQDGQALVEYSLVLVLVALVSVGVLSTLGENISTTFSRLAGGF